MSADPLTSAPKNAKALFEQLSRDCNGFERDDVVVAAMNLLINVIRQNRAKRSDAETLWDEISAKGKHILLEQHYDNSGRRRNVYPFHQVVDQIEHVYNLNKIRGM